MRQLQRTILIVENRPEDREIYRQSLLADPEVSYTILEEESAAAGLALCRVLQPDGILLNYELPDWNGLTFLAQLQNQLGVTCPPVVVVDGGDTTLAVKVIKSGAEDYLVKAQTTPDDLRLAVRSAIENAELRRQLQQREAQLRQSEECYRMLVEEQTDLICRFLPDGTLTFVNSAYSRYFGFSSQQLIGQSCLRLIPEVEQATAQQYLTELQLLTPEQPSVIHEHKVIKSNGEIAWQHWNHRALFDPKGQLVELQGVGRDITVRKQAEIALQQSEARFRQLFQFNLIGVMFWDVEGRVLDANDAFLNIVSYTREDLQAGRVNWRAMTPPEQLEGSDRSLEKMRRETADTREKHYIRKDGSLVLVLLSGVMFEGSQNQGVSFVIDLTELRRAEAASRQSQAQLQHLLDTAPIGIGFGTSTGEVLAINDVLLQIHGYTREEFEQQGINWLAQSPPEYAELNQQAMEQLGRQGVIPPAEKEIMRRDGTRVPVWISATAWQDDTHVAFVVDLTERKRIEAAVQQSEALFRGVFESDLIGILFWNSQGQITDANEAFVRMTGYSRAEMQAGEIDDRSLTPAEYHAVSTVQFERLQTIGRCTPIEKEYICKDGSRIPILLGGVLLPGYTDRGVAFVLDISERKQWEQEREALLAQTQAAREDAEAANRSKDEFLAIVSHELRAPLSSIMGWAKLLRSRNLDQATTARALETIERNAQNQAQLIDDLLDLSRMTCGQLSLTLAPTDLAAVVETALNSLHPMAEAKQIQLDVEIGAGLAVAGDEHRLQQIVTNLLTNAIKFTSSPGQVKVWLERVKPEIVELRNESPKLRLENADVQMSSYPARCPIPNPQLSVSDAQSSSFAQLTITDTGKGIQPNFLPFIFDRFRQADGSTTRARDGLGLGLAIVKHLVELHSGIISAASPGEGRGSTFTVWLPLLETDKPNRVEDMPELPSNLYSVASPLAGLRLLVVDDDVDTVEFLRFALQQFGAVVESAASADAAFEALQRFQPNLLLSDIGMPGGDGYGLIQRIRALTPEQGGNIPAIAVTAYAGGTNEQQALAAGFQRHLAKPVEPETLVRTIMQLIGERDEYFVNRVTS